MSMKTMNLIAILLASLVFTENKTKEASRIAIRFIVFILIEL